MNNGREILDHLRQCTGSEKLFRHPFVRGFTYTEGVQFFIKNAGSGAYWLIDILSTEPAVRQLVLGDGPDCGFANVVLMVTGSKAVLTVDDGNRNVKFTRHFDYTDCPARPVKGLENESAWTFFIEPNQLGDGTRCMTMMWPSER